MPAELLSVAGLVLALVLFRVAGDRPAATGDRGARWARRGDLAVLSGGRRVRDLRRTGTPRLPPAAARLALGYHGGRLLRAEQRHALVAFGPPQSGKSAGLAIPALLEWQGPAVASSIKTDLLDATLGRRRRLGQAYVFDPFELSGIPGHTWTPLRRASTWDGALEAAWRLAAAGELDQRAVEGGDFWAVAAEQRLAPLLYVAARSGGGIEQVVHWAYGQGRRSLDSALDALMAGDGDERTVLDARAAYDAIGAFDAQADRTRTSIEATVQALLRAYRFTRVARSARGCQITPEGLLGSCATLYLIGDAKASKLLRPIFLALLSEVIDVAYELANRGGGRLERPLLVCLDEAGNVAPLPNLAEIASTAPSHNIQLISIFHDLAQARSRYHQQAETVVMCPVSEVSSAGYSGSRSTRVGGSHWRPFGIQEARSSMGISNGSRSGIASSGVRGLRRPNCTSSRWWSDSGSSSHHKPARTLHSASLSSRTLGACLMRFSIASTRSL